MRVEAVVAALQRVVALTWRYAFEVGVQAPVIAALPVGDSVKRRTVVCMEKCFLPEAAVAGRERSRYTGFSVLPIPTLAGNANIHNSKIRCP